MTFHKYIKIKSLGDPENEGILTIPGKVVLQEKVDGANFAFFVEEGVLHFCSHNQNLTDSEQIAKTGIPENWRAIEPVLDIWEEHPERFNPSLYYYAESMQKHTITYDDIPGCIGFDILNNITLELLDYENARLEFLKIGLPFIHVYGELGVEEITTGDLKSLYQESAYRNGTAEGVVIKRYDIKNKYDKPLFAKIVDDDFKEKNRIAFGGGEPTPKKTNEIEIAEIYSTPARIEKIIHKLHDDGNEISMPLMKILFREVIKDILDEEIVEIYQNYKSIDFKALESLVSKKCVKNLKRVMMNDNK